MSALHDIELKNSGKKTYIIIMAVLVIGIPLQIFPFFWTLTNAFKSSMEIIQMPPTFLPKSFGLDNILMAFKTTNLLDKLWNTLILCGGVIVVQVTISAMAAFALSKLRPAGGRAILLFFLGTMMISEQATVIPTYLMMYDFPVLHLNLINSNWSVILAFSAWAWAIFIFKGFFDGIPEELIESARIDGATSTTILLKIILPLSKAVFAVVILNTFMAVYNQFVFPLTLLPDSKKWTIMILIYATQSPWNKVMVLLVASTIPLILLYVFAQKYIVQGITMTGLKG